MHVEDFLGEMEFYKRTFLLDSGALEVGRWAWPTVHQFSECWILKSITNLMML